MALPKMNYPKYKTTIPSTGEIVTYRPFTVADEKLLLTAAQSEDLDEMVDATKELIGNCFTGIGDIDKLTTYDVDFLFIQLRIKSVSPTSELFFKNMQCEKTGGECDKTIKLTVNLEDIKVMQYDGDDYKEYTPNKSKHGGYPIELTDTIGVVLKHPGIKERASQFLVDNFTEDDLIKSCIVSVYDEESVYVRGEDFTDEEFDEWYEGLNTIARNKIKEFTNNIPELRYETKFVCKECGFTESIKFQGIADFFD